MRSASHISLALWEDEAVAVGEIELERTAERAVTISQVSEASQ